MPKTQTDLPETETETEPVEAAAPPLKFTFRGDEWEAPADFRDSIEFHETIEDGDFTKLARAILGPAQWRQFKLKHTRYTDALELANAWSDAAGLGK